MKSFICCLLVLYITTSVLSYNNIYASRWISTTQRIRPLHASSLPFGPTLTRQVSDVIIESPSLNSRRITASVVLDCPLDAVWSILTDYNNLASHVPNLMKSYTIPNPNNKKGIRLFQEGAQKIIGFDFRASLTMDLVEEDSDQNSSRQEKTLHFKLADSAMFSSFDGSWSLKYHSRSRKTDPATGQYIFVYKTQLTYSVWVRPKGLVPVVALEWRIKEDVPTNLMAVKAAAESLYTRQQQLAALPAVTSSQSVRLNDGTMSFAEPSRSTAQSTTNPLVVADLTPLPTSIAKRVYQSMWDEDETLGMYIGSSAAMTANKNKGRNNSTNKSVGI